MSVLRGIAMTLAFVLELVMLAAFGWCGFAAAGGGLIGAAAGLAVVAAAATLWGVLLAPKAAKRLVMPRRLLAEDGMMGLAAVSLGLVGQGTVASCSPAKRLVSLWGWSAARDRLDAPV